MAVSKKVLLIIHEGDTEEVFYRKVIAHFIDRKLRAARSWHNAESESNIAFHNVRQWVLRFLNDHPEVQYLFVLVVYDREGGFDKPDKLNLGKLEKDINSKRLKSIHQIIATKQLESWFHFDAEGIYNYLSVPRKNRKQNPYPSPHNLTSQDLSSFCKKHKKLYPKGKGEDAKAFIDYLNLDTIYQNCEEFRNGVDLLKRLL